MLLKTYRASSLAAALDQARAELGPEALVLATTETEGRLGLAVVEVTVATARAARPGTPSGERDAEPVEDAVRKATPARATTNPLEYGPAGTYTRPVRPSVVAPTLPDSRRESTDRGPVERTERHPTVDPKLDAAVLTLVHAGLSHDLAWRFARIAADRCPRPARACDLAEAAVHGVQQMFDFRALPAAPRCLFVVGPPGSGKTTTVAKLAARAVARSAGRVFFAQADRDRIGAFEQAEIFSRYIGSVPARIEGADDLCCVLEHAGPDGHVFVDTCGVGAGGGDRVAEIDELRRRVPGASVALLLPSGIHAVQATSILDRFRPLAPDCVGLSRVDDGARPGELVTALAERGLPLAFFTNGPSVPDDLEAASPHALAALLLRAGRTPAPAPGGCR